MPSADRILLRSSQGRAAGRRLGPLRRLFCAGLVLSCVSIAPAQAGNWPAWRGPAGTGVSDEQHLPLTWSEHENVRWHVDLPDRGNSTPIIWNDRVFITQAIEKEHRRTVMCFDAGTGKQLWQSGVTYTLPEPTNGQNPYCAASPVTDGQRVIAYFGSAGLYCYDFDGKELWHRDVGQVDSWQGSGSSPILYDNLCILNAGPGSNAVLIACDKRTGEVAWKVNPPKVENPMADDAPAQPAGDASATSHGAPEPAPPATRPANRFDSAMMSADPSGAGGYFGSWSTPVVIRAADRDQLIVVHALQVTAYDPATGKSIWTCKGLPVQAFASPAIGEGILVATGHRASGGTRVTAIKLDPSAHGDITATHRLWQTDLPKDCVGSPIIAAGRAWIVTQLGTVACLDLATGKKQWEKRLPAHGSLGGSWSSFVLAEGKLWVANQSGDVFVLKPGRDFQLLARNAIADENTCASLAVADGCFLLRTWKALWCIGKPPH